MIDDQDRLRVMGEIRDELRGVREGIAATALAFSEAVDHDELNAKLRQVDRKHRRSLAGVVVGVAAAFVLLLALGLSNRFVIGRVDCNVRTANQEVLDRLERQGYLSHDGTRIDAKCRR